MPTGHLRPHRGGERCAEGRWTTHIGGARGSHFSRVRESCLNSGGRSPEEFSRPVRSRTKIPERPLWRNFPVPRAKSHCHSTCSAEFRVCETRSLLLPSSETVPLKFRRAKPRGIFPSPRVILAYARLTRQEPLGSLQNSHFASQNRASCAGRKRGRVSCTLRSLTHGHKTKIPERPLWRNFPVPRAKSHCRSTCSAEFRVGETRSLLLPSSETVPLKFRRAKPRGIFPSRAVTRVPRRPRRGCDRGRRAPAGPRGHRPGPRRCCPPGGRARPGRRRAG